MSNNNLIASPQITGNIGSCSTDVVKVYGDRGAFTVDVNQIITNSCTGEVTYQATWEYTDFFTMLMIIGLLFGAFFGMIIFD